MSWFRSFTPPPPYVIQNQSPPPAPVPPDVSKVEVGARVGNLTCLGSFWLDMSTISSVWLNPTDGCGAELYTADGKIHHLSAWGAACLQKYLDQELSKSSEVKELERMIG